MRLKFYFLILAFLLLILGVLSVSISMGERTAMFYAVEGIVVVGIVFLVIFYRKVVRPLATIANGMDLLREQDFGSRLALVGQREADRIVEVFNRMMQRLKEERLQVREQNHFLDLLIAASPMGIVIFDTDGRVQLANEVAVKMLCEASTDEITGKRLADIGTPLSDAIDRIGKESVETVRLSDAMIYRCSRLSFMDHGYAHPFVLIESLTAEVVKAEKMAYEKVIRMIAHEVNNTMAGVSSAFDTIDESLTDVADADDLREVVRVCGDRCISLSRFISAYADVVKIPAPTTMRVSLNDTVTACKSFMESMCNERDITLRLNICDTAPMVSIDQPLFEQVLVNIIKNSTESIGRGGEIAITITDAPVALEIADNGAGISEEVSRRIFTPFFSSKPGGQGLGLLFVSEVLKKHGCAFSLRTYPDSLTRFRIQFPD